MSKPLVFLSCGLLLLLTGCWLGDRFFTVRTVAVSFPAPAGQNSVALSVDDTQVRDALRVIDTVLTSQGFHQYTNAPAQNAPSQVVSYTTYTGTGLRPMDGPTVYLKTNRLEVVVMEWGNRRRWIPMKAMKAIHNRFTSISMQPLIPSIELIPQGTKVSGTPWR